MAQSPEIPMPDNEWIGKNPFDLFSKWQDEAKTFGGIKEPTGMSVSTINGDGHLSSRVVLLKSFSPEGFVFYTNYDSEKGESLSQNNNVALLFHWDPMSRQVRINGTAEKTSREVSEKYWASRPYDSQLSQYVSNQSHPVPQQGDRDGRDIMKEQVEKAREAFHNKAIPCPPHCGGFIVKPNRFEFWQGRSSRLHDRFRYTLDQGQWRTVRLYP